MAKVEATVEELVMMIERGELRLPEMQRQYVWRSSRVRDLMDSLYRGYPSGAILLWETDEDVPQRTFAVHQVANPYQSVRLLLDGQQRLTSLSAVIRGQPLQVRGRRRPIEILFNLEHPDKTDIITEVDENGSDNDEDDSDDEGHITEDAIDSTEDELQQRFNRMTFVVGTRKLSQLPEWVRVSDVFQTDSDATFLRNAGVSTFDDDMKNTANDWLGCGQSEGIRIGWTYLRERCHTTRLRRFSFELIHLAQSCEAQTLPWLKLQRNGVTPLKSSLIFKVNASNPGFISTLACILKT
jgi:hypothetical protein